MGLNMSKAQAVLKTLYTNKKVENLCYTDHPWLALIQKNEMFFGENKKIPLIYGSNRGRSATFADAQANKGNGKYASFLIERVKDYSIASFDAETVESSENDKGAFLNLLKSEVDGAMISAAQSDSQAVWGNGSGSIGKIASGGITGDVLTLENTEDIIHYEVDQVIVAAAAETTGALRSGDMTITEVDRDAGTITVDTKATSLAAADFLFCKGDRNAKMSGFFGWIPNSAPTSGDSFFGLDRSSDSTRLGGVRFDATGMSKEEALIKGLARHTREGARPDFAFMNSGNFGDLLLELGSKVNYVDIKSGMGDIGFRGVQVHAGKRTITVLVDDNVPGERIAVIQRNTWVLNSLKKSIRILDLDGNKFLRESGSDGYELRVGGYKQVECSAPAYNMNIKLS